MKLRYKILTVLLSLAVIAFVGLGFTLSYESECRSLPPVADGAETMQAVVYRCYGGTDVLELVQLAKPAPADDAVLVRVRAASVNPYEWHFMTGTPYVMRLESGIGAPRNIRFGVDFAGVVEAAGPDVTKFSPGDRVFGGRNGAYAEYVTVGQDRAIAKMPDNVTFEQAAAVGIAGITALQAVRDRAGVQAGDKVLINGASGGVGTFALQMAKALGAEVTGVASARHLDLLRTLGADEVIDYRQQDFIDIDTRWDAVIDNVGNFSPGEIAGVLKADGALVLVGGQKGNWFAPFIGPLKALIYAPFLEPEMGGMLAVFRQQDLETIAAMMADGYVTPVIDRRFPLAETAAAIEYWRDGPGAGKVIIDVP